MSMPSDMLLTSLLPTFIKEGTTSEQRHKVASVREVTESSFYKATFHKLRTRQFKTGVLDGRWNVTCCLRSSCLRWQWLQLILENLNYVQLQHIKCKNLCYSLIIVCSALLFNYIKQVCSFKITNMYEFKNG